MIENFITSIDLLNATGGNPMYIYRGDGHGDWEYMYSTIKSVKLLDNYEEYLTTQLEYVRTIRNEQWFTNPQQ